MGVQQWAEKGLKLRDGNLGRDMGISQLGDHGRFAGKVPRDMTGVSYRAFVQYSTV